MIFILVVTGELLLLTNNPRLGEQLIPTLATRKISSIRKRAIWGLLLGASAYLLVLFLSVVLDLPSGSVIVWSLAVVGLLVNFVFSKSTILKPVT